MAAQLHSGVFVGIAMPEDCETSLESLSARLKQMDASLKLQPVNSAHLTLLYLGNIKSAVFASVRLIADELSKELQPFAIDVGGYLCLGSKANPRVIALDVVDHDKHLERLATRLQSLLAKYCQQPETRAFKPHLTLARIVDKDAFYAHQTIINQAIGDVYFKLKVDRIRLYEARDGLRQQTVEDYPFAPVNKAAAF